MSEIRFNQEEIIDGEEAGIGSLVFSFTENEQGNFTFGAYMNPDDEVVDADEGDFPQFDCMLNRSQFMKVRDAINEALNGI